MNGDVQVRFCEQLRVKFPGLTRLSATTAGAESSSVLYSLIETAKANGLDAYDYIYWLCVNFPKATTVDDYELLLPWHAKKFLKQKPVA